MRKLEKNTKVLPFLFIVLNIFFISCKKDETTTALKPGDNYKRGIIFYLDTTKTQGLIAAPIDQSITDPCWNGIFVITGAASNTDGSTNNLAEISAQENSGTYAARICRIYNGDSYKNWFLPSKDQLNILFNQKSRIKSFTAAIYWTSTEESEGSEWVQDFETGEQHLDNTSDGANVHSRPIRAFLNHNYEKPNITMTS